MRRPSRSVTSTRCPHSQRNGVKPKRKSKSIGNSMKNAAVLSRTFPARISATEALIESVAMRTDNAPQLRQAADALDRVGPLYGRASTAEVYAAFAELLRTWALLIEVRT